MDPARFQCILNDTALKQSNPKRLYLLALPAYIEEREERMRKLLNELNQNVDELDLSKNDDNSPLKKIEVKSKYPLRTKDNAIDPNKLLEAQQNKKNYQKIFDEM